MPPEWFSRRGRKDTNTRPYGFDGEPSKIAQRSRLLRPRLLDKTVKASCTLAAHPDLGLMVQNYLRASIVTELGRASLAESSFSNLVIGT